jgi:beta-N-acetylhexosaminidase
MFYKKNLKIFVTLIFLNFAIIQANWPEEILSKLSLDEKIGQLFTSATIINPDISNLWIKSILENIDQTPIEELITKYHIGGVLYLGYKTTTPKRELAYTNKLQKLSNLELFIAQDLEWGLDARIKKAIKFPFNITLGAIQDNNLIYKLGKEIGRQCQVIGVNFNLAPVCDVNTNPENPIINHRSFGQNPENVAQKAIAFMLGQQDAGVMACAKHFPGHGDTKLDSHLDLPLIEHNLERLENIELYPFKKIIDAGIMSVMTAHLEVPALEPQKHTPATISYKITTELLKNKLKFNGLVITDGLNMGGALKYCKPGELELKALLAGADILLCPRDTPTAILAIKDAIKNGVFSEAELDKKVLKILKAKDWILKNKPENNSLDSSENTSETLTTENAVNKPDNFMEQLNSEYAQELNQEIYKNAVTLVQNTNNTLPLKLEETQKNIALVQISDKKNQLEFFENIKKGASNLNINFEKFYLSNNATPQDVQNLILKLKKYDTVIVGLYSMTNNSKENFGIQKSTLEFLNFLSKYSKLFTGKKIILTVFGNPYSLKLFEDYNLGAIIAGYEHDESQYYAAKIILGELKPVGTLPVFASKKYYASLGLTF